MMEREVRQNIREGREGRGSRKMKRRTDVLGRGGEVSIITNHQREKRGLRYQPAGEKLLNRNSREA